MSQVPAGSLTEDNQSAMSRRITKALEKSDKAQDKAWEAFTLAKEIDVIEYCRTIILNTLNNLIIKYGQDLKNEQWVLEPLADMVISFSVMHLGFLRYNSLENKNKQFNTLPVLRASLSRHVDILLAKCMLINNYIYNE